MKFCFNLSDADAARVYALKEEWEENDKTGNDFLQLLVEMTLHKLYPERVQYDERDNIIPRKRVNK